LARDKEAFVRLAALQDGNAEVRKTAAEALEKIQSER
jgi:HEAT repeat protein